MGGRVHHVGGGCPGEEAPLGLIWFIRTVSHQFPREITHKRQPVRCGKLRGGPGRVECMALVMGGGRGRLLWDTTPTSTYLPRGAVVAPGTWRAELRRENGCRRWNGRGQY